MKRGLLKAVSLLLGLSLLLPGCSGAKEKAGEAPGVDTAAAQTPSNVTEPGTFPVSKEKVTLKAFTTRDVPAGKFDMDTNWFVKYYEEKTNVHIDWELVIGDSNQQTQKLNIKLASGDYPDIFLRTPMSKSQVASYGGQKLFIPLNRLIEKYAPNVMAVFKDVEGIREQLTALDGNIYGLPSVNQAYHVLYPNKMWVNRPWLEKLKITPPTNTDEFYEMLKAFKTKDPNGNGKEDEIPLAAQGADSSNGLFTYLMNPFIYYDESMMMLENGKIDTVADKPEFREGLKYIAKLYKEGLIASNTFTLDRTQRTAIGMSDPPILGAANALFMGIFMKMGKGDRTDPYFNYNVALTPLKGPKGVQQTPEPNINFVGNAFLITKNCKTPEVAMRWVDWMYSEEGTKFTHYGPERKDEAELTKENSGWRSAAPNEIGVNGKPATWRTVPNNLLVNFGLYDRIFPMYQSTNLHSSQVAANPNDPEFDQESLLWRITDKQMVPYVVKKRIPPMFMSDEIASAFAEQQTVINNAIREGMAQFVTGYKDPDRDWDAYVSNLNKLGMKQYIEMYQKEYDKNKNKK